MSCYNSIVIDAPVEQVWDAFADFHDMSKFSNVITSLEVVGETPGDQPGAKRILNGVFHETLLTVDPDGRKVTYSIDDGPDAISKDNVSGYVGEVKLSTADGGTLVEWSSSWESGGEGAAEFCNPIYQALLGDLASRFAA